MSKMPSKPLSSMYANANDSRKHKNGRTRKKRLSPEELADLKRKSRCNACHKFGHWSSEHNADGSLPATVRSTDKPSYSNSTGDQSAQQKTMTFNMVHVSQVPVGSSSKSNLITNVTIGPLLDDGAPYSAIGLHELKIISMDLLPNWSGDLDIVPASLKGCTKWQYGVGEHSSAESEILGSIVLSAISNHGSPVMIRHLVLQGSSQWVVGRNVTTKGDILHAECNKLRFPRDNNSYEYISLIDHDMHSYIPRKTFTPLENRSSSFCGVMTAMQATPIADCSWKMVKHTVDKVHKHVCGHAPYSDIKLLLYRNNFWNDSVERYLNDLVEKCSGCRRTSLPEGTRKFSLSSMSRYFNVVCVDHFFLHGLCMFHAMDSVTRYSACSIVPDTKLSSAVLAFESCWVNQFWPPTTVVGDVAFGHDEFKQFLTTLDI